MTYSKINSLPRSSYLQVNLENHRLIYALLNKTEVTYLYYIHIRHTTYSLLVFYCINILFHFLKRCLIAAWISALPFIWLWMNPKNWMAWANSLQKCGVMMGLKSKIDMGKPKFYSYQWVHIEHGFLMSVLLTFCCRGLTISMCCSVFSSISGLNQVSPFPRL